MTVTNEMISEEKILFALEELYCLPRPLECTFLRRSFNDHYSVNSRERKLILRIYRNKKKYIQDITDLRFELDLLEFLHSNGISVASPIRNENNENLSTIIYKNELRYIALFNYAEGNQIEDVNVWDAKSFGKLVANLHVQSNHFKSNFSRYKIDPHYLIKEPLRNLEKYIQTLEPWGYPIYLGFNKRANLLFEKLKQLPLTNGAYGIIHGDLNPSNIHFSKKHGFTIFDFDHCAYGWRIHDLAVTRLCFNDNIFNEILDGYQSVHSLSLSEVKSIDLYSDVLLLRKSKDILDMLEVNRGSEKDRRKVISNAIVTMGLLIDKPLN